MWTWADNRAGWTAYLSHDPGQPSEPDYAVPARREDLSGLPPTWIGCGDKDLFFDENQRYATSLGDARVKVEFYEVPGGPHGFHVLEPDSAVSKAFIESSVNFIRKVDEHD